MCISEYAEEILENQKLYLNSLTTYVRKPAEISVNSVMGFQEMENFFHMLEPHLNHNQLGNLFREVIFQRLLAMEKVHILYMNKENLQMKVSNLNMTKLDF